MGPKLTCPNCNGLLDVKEAILDEQILNLKTECPNCKKTGKFEVAYDFIKLQKIEKAIEEVKEYRKKAMFLISLMQKIINQVITALETCPGLDPHLTESPSPAVVLLRDSDGMYYTYLCDDLPSNAEIARDNAEALFDYIKKIKEVIKDLQEYVESQCSGNGLGSSNKSQIKSTLNSCLSEAQSVLPNFNTYLADLEQIRSDYIDCLIERGRIIKKIFNMEA